MCQCLNNQTELDQFAESGGVPVLDIVKHVGAGIASILPLGVYETRRAHLQPAAWERHDYGDRLVGQCTCRLQRRSKDLGKQVRARGVSRHPVQIRRGIVGRGATSLVRAQLEGLQ